MQAGRDICEEAEVSANAVHYHFGSKEGLYRSILESFMAQRLASAERMLSSPPADVSELGLRLRLFCEETLVAMLEEPDVLVIAFAELPTGFTHGGREVAEAIQQHEQRLTDFLRAAQLEGLLREDVDPAIVSGTLLERITNQARYVDFHEDLWGTTPRHEDYRRSARSSTFASTEPPPSTNPTLPRREQDPSSRGGTMQFDLSVTVDRPIDEVFAYTGDLGRVPEWAGPPVVREKLTDGPIGVGTRYRAVDKMPGRRIEFTEEITGYEPNQRFKMRMGKPFNADIDTTFEATNGSTNVDMSVEITPTGFIGLVSPFLAGPLKKMIQRTSTT